MPAARRDSVLLSYKGAVLDFSDVDLERTSVQTFAEDVSRRTGVGLGTIKFAGPGLKLIKAEESPTSTLWSAGIRPGVKLLLLGSAQSEVDAVQSSKDLPGLAGFDHELRTLAARRRSHSTAGPSKLPTGPHTFRQFETWQLAGLSPPPAEALKLLHRLAADPGIVGIMQKHSWAVGKLSEMPPEGKVGVSPVCILGVNINAGQEISLRLRTDDLKGFRRYLSIRETLCHELAHMVFGEHDLNFKCLNSQLRRECEEMSRTSGVRLSEAAEGWSLDVPLHPADVMGATASSSGQTLRQLAGDAALHPHLRPKADPKEIQALGHRDATTEAREREADRLGALPQQVHEDSSQENAERPHVDNIVEPAESPNQAATTEQRLAAPEPRAEGKEADVGAGAGYTAPGPFSKDPVLVGKEAMRREPDFSPMGGDDSSAEYFQRMKSAVQKLVASLEPQDATKALETLATILKNALQNPSDARFRRVRRGNAAFHSRAGQHPKALELLQAAGFVAEREGQEEVLRLSRNDPGLLWIALSACEHAS